MNGICKKCNHWDRYREESLNGICYLAGTSDTFENNSDYFNANNTGWGEPAELITREDFGCNQFHAK